jgi:putative ABC transport system substrate-binding protein
MRRRQFLGLLGGAAATWPLAARAQEKVRRIGVLMHATSDEPETQARMAAFLQGLQGASWEVGRNLRVETRWSGDDFARLRKNAAELVALNPDVILAGTGPTAPVLVEATRNVPIVFAQSIDPVGSGLISSLSRPGGNATGFLQFEYDLAGKWLELLKEIAPQIKRVEDLARTRGILVHDEGMPRFPPEHVPGHKGLYLCPCNG